ncbi:hypothetical protein K470DRAFT_298015 [Piedraia hortae CBS 480.64]|uniref:Zn(2)-C6 fungal-type domain-containing protein n=1 Tax=Piedraia hortae CBS 480.64 TaxID=1314780 RepID=A0A6A7C756_9PEZI|nr:hypothetical protein K470DRAFT_298015 [Piedraia hortae CBS 480.64]
MPNGAGSGPVKRACDACHRRKVKCVGNGVLPCKNCSAANLSCTFNAVPQKKGPKGSRAKIISALRETRGHGSVLDMAQLSPSGMSRPSMLTDELMWSCIEYFFVNLYPTQPILIRQDMVTAVAEMESNVEAYCLVLSVCAYMLIQPNMTFTADGTKKSPQADANFGNSLLQDVLRVRKNYNYVENCTIWSILTSFFIFASHFCLNKHNTAWFHMREATTLTHMMGLADEGHYALLEEQESIRQRRLYWLLFLTERAYALQQHRPLTLPATIEMPTVEEGSEEAVELSGFISLVRLFKPFDETFVGVWNKAKTGCTTQWLAQLQQQLSDALPAYLRSTENQAVDLRCTQQWLRTMVWQLSISLGFLSSAAAENSLSFNFPLEVSGDLVAAASQFSQQAMEVHGIGLVQKLFDVACTLTDVLTFVPYEQNTFEYGPRDYLAQLVNLISTLRGGQERYMPLLMSKIGESLTNFPTPGFGIPAVPSSLSGIYDDASASTDACDVPYNDTIPPHIHPIDPGVRRGVQARARSRLDGWIWKISRRTF